MPIGIACGPYLTLDVFGAYASPRTQKTKRTKTMKELRAAIVALVSLVKDALGVNREDKEQLAKIRSEYDARIQDLEGQLRSQSDEDEAEQKEVEELTGLLNETLEKAAAAKVPTEENVTAARLGLSSGENSERHVDHDGDGTKTDGTRTPQDERTKEEKERSAENES